MALQETIRGLLEAPPVFEDRGCRVSSTTSTPRSGRRWTSKLLAAEASPAGLLARDLLLLAGPDCDDRRRLVAEARDRLRTAGGISDLHAVARPVSEDETIDALQRAGRAVLARLVEQRR